MTVRRPNFDSIFTANDANFALIKYGTLVSKQGDCPTFLKLIKATQSEYLYGIIKSFQF